MHVCLQVWVCMCVCMCMCACACVCVCRALTGPMGGVGEQRAALHHLHGLCQRGARPGPVQEGCVERLREHLRGCRRYRPLGHAHTLDPRRQHGPGQPHHPVGTHPAAGLWEHPGDNRDRKADFKDSVGRLREKGVWSSGSNDKLVIVLLFYFLKRSKKVI